MANSYYVYVLACADGTLYTGYTTDPKRREREHNAGVGAKYTRPETRRPCRMLLTVQYADKHTALSVEARFKRLSRAEKVRRLRALGVKNFSNTAGERIERTEAEVKAWQRNW